MENSVYPTLAESPNQIVSAKGNLLPKVALPAASKFEAALRMKLTALDLYGCDLTGAVFEKVVYAIAHTASPTLPIAAVRAAVSVFAVKAFTYATARYMSEWFAANKVAVSANEQITPQFKAETVPDAWTLMRFTDIKPFDDKQVTLTCKVVWGPWCGVTFERTLAPMGAEIGKFFWSMGMQSRRDDGIYPLCSELVNLYGFAYIVTNREDAWTFYRTDNSTYIKGVNKKLIKARQEPCVHGLPVACSTCAIGYDLCFRGTRATTDKESLHYAAIRES